LTLLGIVGLYFTSTSYLEFGGSGVLKLPEETTRESTNVLASLGTKDMLKDKKKLSIISQTSFL
jgi:hypothetical protein